jgi:hypothetical protein
MMRVSSKVPLPLLAIVAGALMTLSCYTSPKPQAIREATNPYGARGTVTLSFGRKFEGELLALTDTSLVMLVDGRVATVRTSAMSELVMPMAGVLKYAGGRAPSSKQLERARHMMRYPYGIQPGVMAALLAKSAQQAPDDLETKT